MAQGAPLRFMGFVLAGWTSLRVAMLWPADLPPRLVATPVLAETAAPVASRTAPRAAVPDLPRLNFGVQASREDLVRIVPTAETPPARFELVSPSVSPLSIGTEAVASPASRTPGAEPEPRIPRPIAPLIASRPHLAGDGWLVLRPGGGDSLAFGQLGASQGGARLTYALDAEHRAALSARLSSPLHGNGREAAVGVDLRPTALPVHLLVEERFGVDGGGARPAAGLIAGVSSALPAGARLDAYGQAGAVWRRGGFVDTAALVARPVLRRGTMRVEVGGGAWGAAQRLATRLDVGPSAALVAPVAGRTLRLQVDYRLRVTGSARPGSGPALTLGGSF